MVFTTDIKEKINDLACSVASGLCEEYGTDTIDERIEDDEIYDFEKLKAKAVEELCMTIDNISEDVLVILK